MGLTIERLRELLQYEEATGLFRWKVRTNRLATVGAVAGRVNSQGRRQIGIDGKRYQAHRLVWFYKTGVMPQCDLDHIDNDHTNNRFENLRLDPSKDNQQNQTKPHRNNKSGFLGVSPCRGKWAATISVKGAKRHLGLFASPIEAYEAYVAAKRAVHAFSTI